MAANEYELIIIIRPDLDEASAVGIIEKIEATVTGGDGILLVRDDWGQRKLAYIIRKHQKGRYVLFKFIAPPALVAEVERKVRIEDDVLRFLTVRRPDVLDVQRRIAEAQEERVKLAEEAARRAAEESEMAERGEQDEDEDYDNDEASSPVGA